MTKHNNKKTIYSQIKFIYIYLTERDKNIVEINVEIRHRNKQQGGCN